VIARLYHIRNPWNVDKYTGPWNDTDSRWTPALRAQVPYINNTNDGGFFIEEKEFVYAFNYFTLGYIRDGWNNSYYEVLNDTTGALQTFTFTTTKA